MRVVRGQFAARPSLIARSAQRLERLEDIGAPRVIVQHERDLLRRLTIEMAEEVGHADDVRWRFGRTMVEC